MYAIVDIAGQQFKVEKGKKVFVHKLAGKAGDEVSFNRVLLISKDDKVNVGAPYLPDALVLAQIVSQLRGDKVLVFKKKRRKGYQKLNGHRQYFTEILIEDIAETGSPRKTEKKKPAEPVITVETEALPVKVVKKEKAPAPAKDSKKAAPKAVSAEKPKKAPVKKTSEAAAKKPAVKKPAAKTVSKSKKQP
jgi:large subunit ribosomal protein L21